ncbi:LytR/AlgR family response regulator transcription factor [Hymenobacter terrenus]|uniref:LytR/AlgR family response regulator transcription factor n=1 Tax=Hymenobacter terrenus TaxID=1629124 RepID=UPI000696FB44|nr:LytTR family DNA-binding domain-containing protein [Hymenobacter terrenus]
MPQASKSGSSPKPPAIFAAGDHWLRLLAVPLIVAINFYILYRTHRLDFLHISSLLADVLQGYVAFELCQYIILWLDTRWAWVEKPIQRLNRQLLLTSAVTLVVFGGLTQGIKALFRLPPFADGRFFDYSFNLSDRLMILIWVGFVNVLYTAWYLYELYQLRELAPPPAAPAAISTTAEAERHPRHLLVRAGKQELLLAHGEVLLFYIEHQVVLALTTAHKRYALDASLDKLETQLDPAQFFRANRQMLLTHAAVKSVRPENNGKLRVTLHELPQRPTPDVVISRLKAAAFRRWLKGSLTATDTSAVDL